MKDYVKSVRSDDLEQLLTEAYLHFVYGAPFDELDDYDKKNLDVEVSTVCANVYDTEEFESKEKQEELLNKFIDYIEKVTLGNLRAIQIECNCSVFEGHYLSWISFSVAYEVDDE